MLTFVGLGTTSNKKTKNLSPHSALVTSMLHVSFYCSVLMASLNFIQSWWPHWISFLWDCTWCGMSLFWLCSMWSDLTVLWPEWCCWHTTVTAFFQPFVAGVLMEQPEVESHQDSTQPMMSYGATENVHANIQQDDHDNIWKMWNWDHSTLRTDMDKWR